MQANKGCTSITRIWLLVLKCTLTSTAWKWIRNNPLHFRQFRQSQHVDMNQVRIYMRCLCGVRASKGWSRCDIVILKYEAHFECHMTLILNQEQTQTVCTYMYIYMYTYIFIYIYTYEHTWIYDILICIHVYMYLYTYKYRYIFIHIHLCTWSSLLESWPETLEVEPCVLLSLCWGKLFTFSPRCLWVKVD